MHLRTPFSALVLSFSLAACASSGGPGGDSAPALAYDLPTEATVVYRQVDSVRVVIDMGGQTVPVTQISDGTLSVDFTDATDGVRLTATWLELESSASNPMAETQRFDEENVDGPLVFDLDRTGEVTVVSTPDLSGTASEMMSVATVASTLLPRLPGRVVGPGERWTDTVQVSANEAAGRIEMTSIVEYTVVGDTLVDGRPMVRVDFVTDDSRRVQASTQGMDINQDIGGEGTGWFLWDPGARLVHSQYSMSELAGTMEVSGAPFPLPLAVEAVSRTTRSGG